MDPRELATGDLLLFTERLGEPRKWVPSLTRWLFDVLDTAISYFTRSPYVHVGLVVVDPPFCAARGTFLWESGYEACVDPETGTQHVGVRLTPIATVLCPEARGSVFVRKCTLPIADAKLSKTHSDVFLKPYDMCLSDWLLATLRMDAHPRKTDRFWCSAFVAYVLTQLGWLPDETDWSIVRPCDLSSSSTYLAWSAPVYLRDTPLSQNLGPSRNGEAELSNMRI
jgi:hypothetical protein